jgi:hypothetical protein
VALTKRSHSHRFADQLTVILLARFTTYTGSRVWEPEKIETDEKLATVYKFTTSETVKHVYILYI